MKKLFALLTTLSLVLCMTACNQTEVPSESDITNEHGFTLIGTNMFNHGLLAVKVGDLWGYVDKNDNIAIEPQFEKAGPFAKNGLAAVSVHGLYGYINTSGQFIIEPQYRIAERFSDNGLAAVFDRDSREYGYIDETGEFVIDPQFDAAYNFDHTGVAVVRNVGGTYSFIDKTGNIIGKSSYSNVWGVDFRTNNHYYFDINGLAWVKFGGLWGIMNYKGKMVIEPQFDSSMFDRNEGSLFSKNGLAPICLDDQYGYINKSGEIVITPQFDYAGGFSDVGLAVVKKDGEYGYINNKGEFVIEPQFSDAEDFSNIGLAAVKTTTKYSFGYINTAGEFVIEPHFLIAGDFSNDGIAFVGSTNSRGTYWNCIDQTGEYVIDYDLVSNSFTADGYVVYKIYDNNNVKFGVVDKEGNIIVNARFDLFQYDWEER